MALSQQFLSGVGTAMKDLLLANVASAVSGVDINILGVDVKPFAFLQGWATDLTNQANAAIANAANAQATADAANAGLSTVSTGVTANVTGATVTNDATGVGPAVQLLNATIQAVGSAPQIDVFNQDGTWHAPAGGKTVDLSLVAASGGSAQGGMGTTGAAGGAGGAGGYSTYTGITMSSLPSSCAVTVGVGGTGGHNPFASFRDDFNRANNSSMGSNWRVDSSGPGSAQILNDAAECGSMGAASGENGRWMTWVGGSLLSDNYIVQAQLVAPANSEATNNYTGVMVAVPNTYGTGTLLVAFVGNTSSGCGLITQSGAPSGACVASGGGSGQAVVANSTTPFTNTSLIALSRVGNVFTGYINGVAIVTWTDTGNTVPTGSGNRGWGFIVEGNYPVFQQQYDSPAIDWIAARDLGVHSQPGTPGGSTSFNGSAYVAGGGGGGVGGGIDSLGVRRPASGSFLNTDTAWNGAQGTGNQSSVNPSGGIGAAGQIGYSPDGAPGGAGLNTSGGVAGTSSSLDGAAGTSPSGGVYGPGSGGGGGYWVTGTTGQAGQGGAGAFPGGAPGGGGATLDGQGSNGPGNAGSDGQCVVTTHFT